jgi:phage shock protein A
MSPELSRLGLSVEKQINAAMPMSSVKSTLWRRRLVQALSASEVMATILGGFLLAVFVGLFGISFSLPAWSSDILVTSVVAATALMVWTAMHDPELIELAFEHVMLDVMRFDRLHDQEVRRLVVQLVKHRAHIERLCCEPRAEIHSTNATLKVVDHWLTEIARLVQLVDPFAHEQPRQSIQKQFLLERIQELDSRIATASNKSTVGQLRQTMASRRLQLRAIEALENLVEQGLLRLEHAVSTLGAMDAKIAVLVATGDVKTNLLYSVDDVASEISQIDAVIVALQKFHSSITQETNYVE